jgi:hypothetical protein
MGYILKVVFTNGEIISEDSDLLYQIEDKLHNIMVVHGRKDIETVVIMRTER